jgi:AraC-like DNA-binding protein
MVISLEYSPRYTNNDLTVERLGYIKEKNYAINRQFSLPSIIFVLSGNGILKINDTTYKLHAPFAIINYPGETKFYSPESSWEELYVGFLPGTEIIFNQRFSPILDGKPFYKIKDLSFINTYLTIILELMDKTAIKGVADQIDNLINLLIIESLLPSQLKIHTDSEQKLLKIVHWINLHFKTDIDLKKLAKKNGLSYSSFQRLWRNKFEFSPIQYILKLRNSEAKSLLLESDLSIADIAQITGFQNQFYFSNFFHKHNGMSPSNFRKKSSRNRV